MLHEEELLTLEESDKIYEVMKDRFEFVDPSKHTFKKLIINDIHLGFLNPQFEEYFLRDLKPYAHANEDAVYFDMPQWIQVQDTLQNIAYDWYRSGIFHGWRDEKFMVYDQQGKALFPLERSSFRPLGFLSNAVHINGIIRPTSQYHYHRFWIGKRSQFKAVDPNKLDNLVGGGVAFNETIHDALLREGFEEAGLDEELLNNLNFNRIIMSRRPVQRGLHREYLHVYDLFMDESITPENQDGEVEKFIILSSHEISQQIILGHFMNDSAISILSTFYEMGYIPKESQLNDWLSERLIQKEN